MQSNKCQNPPPQLSKVIFVTGSTGLPHAKTNPDNLVFAKLSATKPPNKTSGKPLPRGAARSREASLLRGRALKLLKPPSYTGYKSFCMQRGH